jgi:hypothetical protein
VRLNGKDAACLHLVTAGFRDFGFWILDFGLGNALSQEQSCSGPSVPKPTHSPIQNPKSKIQNRLVELAKPLSYDGGAPKELTVRPVNLDALND